MPSLLQSAARNGEILYVKPVSVELAAPGAVVRKPIVYEKTELFMCQTRSRLFGLYSQGLKYKFFRILKQPQKDQRVSARGLPQQLDLARQPGCLP